jgi:translocation and assembly module TamB
LWSAASLAVIAAILWLGVVALLNNASFRQYLLGVAHTKLSESAGIDLRMRDFSLHLSRLTPSVDMYDVVLEGAPPYQAEPLLKADRVSVGIQIVSLLQRKWYLRDVAIDHPVARVFVAGNGDTNLPKTKPSDQSTSVFDLGIRRVTLTGGEVYYNDRKSTLDADLHDLQFQSTFDVAASRYSGGLGYKDGRIQYQSFNPMVHSLRAEFDATPETFELKKAELTSGTSELSLTATVNDYANPKVRAQYQSSLNAGELRDILKDGTLPVGILKTAGTVEFESDPNAPVLETLTVDGNLASDSIQIHTDAMHTLVRDISARYTLRQGNAEVNDLRAQLLGGSMEGSFKMRDVAGAQDSQLHAALHEIPLAGIQALLNPMSIQELRMTGGVNAKLDATWQKTFDTLLARTDADLKGTIAPVKRGAGTAAASESPAITQEASIHARYSASAQEITFTDSYIRTPQTTVNLNGTVSKGASLRVQLQANDLHEIETIADAFGALPEPLGLAGMASFTGTVRGTPANPQIAGQFSTLSLKVKGTDWRSVRTALEADPSHVQLRNGEVIPANNRGRLTFNADVGLEKWAFKDTSPVQADLTASQLSVADLKSLAGLEAPVSGVLSANISVRGSQVNPTGRATINLTQATVSDEPIQSVNLDVEGNGDEMRGRVEVRMPAGTTQGSLTYFPKRKAYEGQLQAASLRLDQLQTLRQSNMNVTGTLALNARGSGTFDNPGLEFTAQIPKIQIQNQTINGFSLQAGIADHVATIALDTRAEALDNTFVRGQGKVKLTGDYEADATFDTSSIALQPLFAIYMPAQASELSGETEVHATVKGPLKNTELLDAHVTIPTLSLKYKTAVELAAAQPIQIDYSRGVITLQKTAIRGTGTDLQLQGTIPVTGSAPASVVALGTIDLAIGRMFAPDLNTSGQLQFNINGTGRDANPDVQGQIKIVNAAFTGTGLPIGLQDGNGALTLTNNRLEIDSFNGNVSGGTVTATGGVTYRPSMQFNLVVAANGIRTLYPPGVRQGTDANLTLVGSPESATLRGQVRLTEVSFSPAFDLDSLAGGLGSATGGGGPPTGFARNLNLDITVVTANDLDLASTKLSLQGAANLRIRGTAAEPAVIGRVNLTGGELFYRNNRYTVEPSSLDFVDPYRIEPRVNLAVSTKVQEYDIHMLFRGTTDQLRTTYTSEPPLAPASIINLLVFGRTIEAQEANPASLKESARSALRSGATGQIASGIERISGFSQVSIDPAVGGDTEDSLARVTIQQRVTGNLFVTFSTDATGTQRQTIKIDYQATPRVGVSALRDQNGGFAFDVRIKNSW